VDPAGLEPALPARQAGVFPLDHRPIFVNQGSGDRTHLLRLPRPADYRFPTPCSMQWTAGGSPPCDDGVFLLDQQPKLLQRSGRGSNPVFRAYQGGVRPQHFQTYKLRRPDLNRRGTAYETVLASRLQSTPQDVSTPGRTRTCADCLHVREVPSPLGHGGDDEVVPAGFGPATSVR
jgi:hypothetical protein